MKKSTALKRTTISHESWVHKLFICLNLRWITTTGTAAVSITRQHYNCLAIGRAVQPQVLHTWYSRLMFCGAVQKSNVTVQVWPGGSFFFLDGIVFLTSYKAVWMACVPSQSLMASAYITSCWTPSKLSLAAVWPACTHNMQTYST